MKLYHHQRGFGLITMVLNIFAIVVILYLGAVLVPIYSEHIDVKTALNDMPERKVIKADSTNASALSDTRMYFAKNFHVQGVKSVPLNQIDIVRYAGGYEVRVKYEVRCPLFSNIDLVVNFNDVLKVPFA